MAKVFVGLGANLGDRRATLHAALGALSEHPAIRVLRASSFIETAPQGGPAQPAYLNAAAELETTLRPRELLSLLTEIEARFGRVRAARWGPRTLDLDILLYDQQVMAEPDLEIPHPRLHEREFVLRPLAQIAPEATHPALGKSILQLLREVADGAKRKE